MDRKKRFFSGLIAGYGAAAANLIFTVSSVPIALHYLSKEEFGLWALVLQIANFLMLLDLGMSSSVARFLADHKDHKNQDTYGNVLQTGKLVFGIQALAMFLLTLLAGLALPGWLGLPSQLVPAFQRLLWIQGLILAVGLTLRGYSSPLWAHQRIDITHWANAANLLTALATVAIGFHLGWGVDTFWISSLCGALWTWFVPWVAYHKLRFFSDPAHPGSFQRPLFLRMLGFGRDIMLMQLGGLLCSASQIILVTKLLGLEAAAVFSVATKTLTMGQQLIGRILESAAPGLTELFVRGDRERFAKRFYQISSISLVAATSLAVGLMTANRDFVLIWTHHTIQWSRFGDFILAGSLISAVGVRCSQAVFGMSADFSRVRWLALGEGSVFVIVTLWLGASVGVEGVLAVALGTQTLVSLIPSAVQTWKAFPSKSFWKECPAWIFMVFLVTTSINAFLLAFAEKPLLIFALAFFLTSAAAFFLFIKLKKQLLGQAPL